MVFQALKKNKDNKKAAYRKALALNASGEVNKAKNLLDDLDQTGEHLSFPLRTDVPGSVLT